MFETFDPRRAADFIVMSVEKHRYRQIPTQPSATHHIADIADGENGNHDDDVFIKIRGISRKGIFKEFLQRNINIEFVQTTGDKVLNILVKTL